MQQDYKTEMRAMTDGLAEWCKRLEHRQKTKRTLRSVVLVVAVVVTAVALLVPQSAGTFVSGDLRCCVTDACDRVDLILAKI